MGEWWQGLTGVNQFFYGAAAFFSVFFLWQLLAALVGLGGGEDADVDGDIDVDADAAGDAGELDDGTYSEFEHGAEMDADATVASFKLVGVRSVLAFCTLFSWAGAMYLNQGKSLAVALSWAIGWGLCAMVVVALIFHLMRRMTESGTPALATSVGTAGMVYLDIPAGGLGEARVPVSGVMTHVRARAVEGKHLTVGTPVRVKRLLDVSTVEVEPVSEGPAE